jgi:hypothetical protein
MYYIKNTSDQTLIEPETNLKVEPGACKQFKDEMLFLRFTAVFNGLCEVITEEQYNRWLASFGQLGAEYGKLAQKAKEEKEEVQEENQETVEVQESAEAPKKKGRPKKQ